MTLTPSQLRIQSFFQEEQIYVQLEHLMVVFAPHLKKPLKLELTFNGGCYTDGETVSISLFDFMYDAPLPNVFSALLALEAHEMGHILDSNQVLFNQFIQFGAHYFWETYGIPLKAGENLVRYIINSIEDGRIERKQKERFYGIIPHLVHMREWWWEEQLVVSDATDYQIWSYALLTLATTGKMPKGVNLNPNSPLAHLLKQTYFWIERAVQSETFEDCLKCGYQIIKLNEPFLVEEYRKCPNLDQELNKLNQIQTPPFQTHPELSQLNPSSSSVSTSKPPASVRQTLPLASEEIKQSIQQALEDATQRLANLESPKIIQEKRQPSELSVELTPMNFIEIPFQAIGTHDVPIDILLKGNTLRHYLLSFLETDLFQVSTPTKRGILNPRSLWHVVLDNEEVFQSRQSDIEDYAIAILVDGSGSMDTPTYVNQQPSTRFQDALQTAAILEEALRGIIPLNITVFTELESIIHYEVKGFEESSINCSYDFLCQHHQAFHRNNDAQSIAYMSEKLLKRPEMNKVLFVLSDGMPTFTAGLQECHQVIQHYRQKGLTIVGIGFGEEEEQQNSREDYRYLYGNSLILTNTSQLMDVLSHSLCRFLKNS